MSSIPITSHFLRELQQVEQIPARSSDAQARQGRLIHDAFRAHCGFSEIAVYLGEPIDGAIPLTTASEPASVPLALREDQLKTLLHGAETDASTLVPGFRMILPLTSSRELLGAVALGGAPTGLEQDRELLATATSYVSALLATHRMAAEIKDGDFQLRYRLWELESLYDIGLSIASMLDLDQLGDEILVRTMSLVNSRQAALYLKKGDRFVLHQTLGIARSEFLEDELNEDAAKKLLVDGVPLTFEEGANCIFSGCQSLVAMPIRNTEEVIGVLAAADREYRDGSVGGFEEGELRLLSRFANQVSIAIQNATLHREALDKQAIERDLELAATIQRNILPRSLPKPDNYEVAVLAIPARQLGGDYHFFFEHDGKFSFCVADVSGKSFPAAILVSALHAALQLLFHEGRELGNIAVELNRHLHKWSSDSKYITLVLATIDQERETLHYVNAGHNPAFLVLPDGVVQNINSHGLPVGLMAGSKYETQTTRFPSGALLAVYSDGITEAVNGAEEEFGEERLTSILVANANRPCAEIRDSIHVAVEQFTAGQPQYDDQTLVLVKTS